VKIAFVIQSLQLAGSEKVAFDLIKQYRGGNIECSLIAIYRSADPLGRERMLSELKAMGVETIELDKLSGHSSMRTLRLFQQAVDRQRPDVVHSHGGIPNMYAGLRNLLYRRIRTVLTLHSGADDWRGAKDNLLERLAIRGADKIVSVAEHVASVYRNRFYQAGKKLVVIENGIDPTTFKPLSPEEKRALRESLGIGPRTPVLINVARIDPIKNQRFLIETAASLKAGGTEFRLLLVGNGQDVSYERELRRRIVECRLETEVALLGSRSDVHGLLQISDAFLFPSEFEASPLALLEAICADLPVVCSNIPANRRLAEFSRESHILERNPESWARTIERLLSTPVAAAPGPSAVPRLNAHLSLERVANDYMRLSYAGGEAARLEAGL